MCSQFLESFDFVLEDVDEDEGSIDGEDKGQEESSSWFSRAQDTFCSEENNLKGANCFAKLEQVFDAETDLPPLKIGTINNLARNGDYYDKLFCDSPISHHNTPYYNKVTQD